MIKYELNITKEYANDCVMIANKYRLCAESIEYIKKHNNDLQKAYEECDYIEWLSYIMHILNLNKEDLNLICEYYFNNKEYNHYITYGNVPDDMRMQWINDYIKYVKKQVPWPKLRKILLEKQLIKKVKQKN